MNPADNIPASQRFLFICRSAPFGSAGFAAGLDLLLTAATFEQPVQLVFTGDGVFQLVQGQDSAVIGVKNPALGLSALALYDVSEVYVDTDAAAAHELDESSFSIAVETIDAAGIQALICAADQVVII